MINITMNIDNDRKREVLEEREVLEVLEDLEDLEERQDLEVKDLKVSNLPIYRFKFTKDFMEELFTFSKIHQYDERNDFKDAWQIWTEDNEEIINNEIKYLTDLKYDGDIMDKMFKSARYYFRKKSTEKKDPKQRRQYISVTRELLDAMDFHIEENIQNENYQPKTGFILFCKENEILIKEALTKIFEQGIKDMELIQNKIKKTYKNRYFKQTKQNNV
jgi:hypothetical protein